MRYRGGAHKYENGLRWNRIFLAGGLALALLVLMMALLTRGQSAPVAEDTPTPRLTPTDTPTPTPEPTPTETPGMYIPDELPDWIQEDLLPINEWSRPGDPMEAMTGIVVHYVGNPGTTAKQNRSYFAWLAEDHSTSASSNFIIGLEGEVILCVPIGEIAYCTKDRNIDTLSIEVCHPDESGKFNQASYDSLIKLVNWLRDIYDLDVDAVIRHYDVTGKECPRYYVRNPEAWDQFKEDLIAAEGEQEEQLPVEAN